jgi:hypothetical protein
MSLDFKGLIGESGGGGGFGSGLAAQATASTTGIGSDGCFPSLTLKQRVIAFASCFVIGMLISFLSSLSLVSGNVTQFGILYTLGNIVALFRWGAWKGVRRACTRRNSPPPSSALCDQARSTAFLFGPVRQFKNMFARTRIVATLVYFAALIGTLVVAIKVRAGGWWARCWGLEFRSLRTR